MGVELAEGRRLRARCPQGGKQPEQGDCGWDPEALQLAPQAAQRAGEGEVGTGDGGNPGKEQSDSLPPQAAGQTPLVGMLSGEIRAETRWTWKQQIQVRVQVRHSGENRSVM